MKFYRPVVVKDFEKKEESFKFLPEPVRSLIEEKEEVSSAVVALLRKSSSLGIYESAKICYEYLSFVFARKDFNDGKIVYTEY